MALRTRLTAGAVRDLQAIRAYLIERSPKGADRVRRDIEATIRTLSEFPRVGHESDIPGARVLPTARYPYLVYHQVNDKELTIVHIRHGRRDAPKPEDF